MRRRASAGRNDVFKDAVGTSGLFGRDHHGDTDSHRPNRHSIAGTNDQRIGNLDATADRFLSRKFVREEQSGCRSDAELGEEAASAVHETGLL